VSGTGTVGGHLAVPRDAGLIGRVRTGRSVHYVLTSPGVELLASARTGPGR